MLVEVCDRLYVGRTVTQPDEEAQIVLETVGSTYDCIIQAIGAKVVEHLLERA